MQLLEKLDDKIMGDRIKLYRELNGWTQYELADKAGLSQPWVSRLEKNKAGLSLPGLRRLAKCLGVTSSHLLGEVPVLADWPNPGAK